MAKNRVNSLLVAENKRLFGILTARDILWIITKKPNIDLTKIRSIDVATKKIAAIKPSADISEALSKMRESNFRRLPVLSHSELIGVVTLKDILVVEPSLYSEVRDIIDSGKEEDRKLKTAGKQWPTEGLCENCGAFSELLNVEGRLLCPDCRDEIY